MGTDKRNPYGRRCVVSVAPSGDIIGSFDSITQAAQAIGTTVHNLWRTIRQQTFCRKLRWMYEEDYRELWMQGRTGELAYNRRQLRKDHIREALNNLPQEVKERRAKRISRYRKKLFENNPDEHLRKMQEKRMRKVRCVTTGETFDSIKLFCDKYGAKPGNAWACLNGRRKHVMGMEIEYII